MSNTPTPPTNLVRALRKTLENQGPTEELLAALRELAFQVNMHPEHKGMLRLPLPENPQLRKVFEDMKRLPKGHHNKIPQYIKLRMQFNPDLVNFESSAAMLNNLPALAAWAAAEGFTGMVIGAAPVFWATPNALEVLQELEGWPEGFEFCFAQLETEATA